MPDQPIAPALEKSWDRESPPIPTTNSRPVAEPQALKAIAVIPARGGSKRLPRKNLINFEGRPLVAWSINTARESNLFSSVVVSTEDSEIATVSRRHGALTPFVRPLGLADDFTPLVNVMRHAITELERSRIHADIYACLLPTAPLMPLSVLEKAVYLSRKHRDSYIFPACLFEQPPQRGFRIDKEGRSHMLAPDMYFRRTQDLELIYHDVGQFFVARKHVWMMHDHFHEPGIPIVVDKQFVQDIDTKEDLESAKRKYQLLKDRDY